MTSEAPIVESVLVVYDFPDVFPVDLPGLQLERDVDFTIEVKPGVKPLSIPLYRMSPTELKELSTQVQGLLDLGFIQLSVSSWGALFYL